jgi:hypothetical protein
LRLTKRTLPRFIATSFEDFAILVSFVASYTPHIHNSPFLKMKLSQANLTPAWPMTIYLCGETVGSDIIDRAPPCGVRRVSYSAMRPVLGVPRN